MRRLATAITLALWLLLVGAMAEADSAYPPHYADAVITMIGPDDVTIYGVGGTEGNGLIFVRLYEGQSYSSLVGLCFWPNQPGVGMRSMEAVYGWEYLGGDIPWGQFPLTVRAWPERIIVGPGHCGYYIVTLSAPAILPANSAWWIAVDWRREDARIDPGTW